MMYSSYVPKIRLTRFNNLDPLHRSQEGGFIYVGGDLVLSLYIIQCHNKDMIEYFIPNIVHHVNTKSHVTCVQLHIQCVQSI